jgi:hypothetical protein
MIYKNDFISNYEKFEKKLKNLYWKKYPEWYLQFKKFSDEEFKEIEGYYGFYFISNYGQIVTFHRKFPFVMKYNFRSGIFSITLFLYGKTNHHLIHDLVYTHFIGDIKSDKKVTHRNRILTDNYYKNLQLSSIYTRRKRGAKKKCNFSLYNKIEAESPLPPSNTIPVLQFDLNGKFIKEFQSLKKAAMACGISSSQISINSVKPRFAGGFQWRYKSDPIFNNGIIDIEPLPSPYHASKRAIFQFDLDGNFIKSYPSILEACNSIKGNYHRITQCARKLENTAHGFQWRYKNDPVFKKNKMRKIDPIPQAFIHQSNTILQYNLNGEFIREYKSIAEAAEISGVYALYISACLRGKTKTTGEFQWLYKKNSKIAEKIPAIKLNRKPPLKPVLQFSLDGKFIKEYESAIKAADELNIPLNDIKRYIYKKNKNGSGFQWRFKSDSFFKNGITDIPSRSRRKRIRHKPILQFDLDGNFIKEFPSVAQAACSLGIPPGVIVRCKNGKSISAAGYRWKEKISDDLEKNIEPILTRRYSGQKTPVLQFNLDGEFLARHPSQAEAARCTGTSTGTIYRCLKGDSLSGNGWQWKLENDPLFKEGITNIPPIHYSRYPRSKPILQFTKSGKFIREYSSINKAAMTIGITSKNLSVCINKNRSSAGGFQWKLKDDPLFIKGIKNIGPVKKKDTSKPILQFDLNGNYIRSYPSIKNAMRITGIGDSSIINCAVGKTRYAGNFLWRYKSDPLFLKGIVNIEPFKKKETSRAVCQFDLKGNYITEYVSSNAAAEQTEVSASLIRMCARKRTKTAGGFQWRYKIDPLFAKGIRNIEPVTKKKTSAKPILQFDLNGSYIGEYSSCAEAARSVGINIANLTQCARKTSKTSGGYQWRYKNDPLFAKGVVNIGPVTWKAKKKVLQFDLHGNYIGEYPSARNASIKLRINGSAVSNCANGYIKSAGGFQWRHKDDPIFANGIVNIGPTKRKSTSKPVIQFDLQGNYIAEYPTCVEAGRKVGIHNHYIAVCAKNKKGTAKGYQWRYRNDPLFSKKIINIGPFKKKT